MKHQTRAILGGLMGNVVEAYDVSICYFLASILSTQLLGDHQGHPSIILTLIFLAYLAKPIGAFFLGLFSDLYGRKKILMLSVIIMGFATAAIGFIPGYNSIGIWAALLLLLFRVIQSMALGSEFLNSASFLVESGQAHQRGFLGCWSSVGVKAGNLLACVVYELTRSAQAAYPTTDWLWRIPSFLAILTTVVGFLIRYRMPESLAYIVYYADKKKPTTQEIYQQSLSFVKKYPFLFYYAFFASFMAVASGFFFYLYFPIHAKEFSHLSEHTIIYSTRWSLVLVTLLIPVFGWMSDYTDRLKMLFFATSALALMAIPLMRAIDSSNAHMLFTLQALISVACACYYSVSTVILTELFPMQIRCTALSIVYSIAASLASGVPPLLAHYMANHIHPVAAGGVMFVVALVVLINIVLLVKHYRLFLFNTFKLIITFLLKVLSYKMLRS